jgi:hypothetical protein
MTEALSRFWEQIFYGGFDGRREKPILVKIIAA